MKKIRILLVSINKIWKYGNIGIDLVAGYLRRNKYFVDIRYFHQDDSMDKILQQISINYDIYGFSVYSSNYEQFKKISHNIKECSPTSIIVWGGAFPSMFYKEFFEDNIHVDYIVLGDGEKPLKYLIQCIKKGKKPNHYSITCRNDLLNKKNYCNKTIRYMPAWDFYEYYETQNNKYRIHCVQSKNNVCTGMCSFCYERKGKIFGKPIRLIYEEIKIAIGKYGVRKIFFSDDNLLDPNNIVAKERIYNLCNLLMEFKGKITYTCYIKAISFRDTAFDNELLEMMSDIGFSSMFIGIESGNEKDLKLYNKFTTVEDNVRICSLLRRHNIVPLIGFINFNPYSTLKTIKDNYLFLKKIKNNNLYPLTCSFLNIYKGTIIHQKALDDGLLTPDYSIFNDLEYIIQDKEAREMILFIKNNIEWRVRTIKLDICFLLKKCEEAIRFNDNAYIFKEILLKENELEIKKINNFFDKLFIECDYDYCKKNIESFIKYFKDKQTFLENMLNKVEEIIYA